MKLCYQLLSIARSYQLRTKINFSTFGNRIDMKLIDIIIRRLYRMNDILTRLCELRKLELVNSKYPFQQYRETLHSVSAFSFRIQFNDRLTICIRNTQPVASCYFQQSKRSRMYEIWNR
ncbi:hypothetical protein BKA69DRAFT_1046009 [Paraphysoderma sedebokerense]|nr:hypothetical protein BKA69DRAFT_1046009 [Paraphysoderma sedebokerense]